MPLLYSNAVLERDSTYWDKIQNVLILSTHFGVKSCTVVLLGKKFTFAKFFLIMGFSLSFVSALALFIAVSRYVKIDNVPQPLNDIFYAHEVTIMAVDAFDLRYYDGGRIDISVTSNAFYNASVCSISCSSSDLTVSVPINLHYNIEMGRSRHYVNFTTDRPDVNVPNIMVLKGTNFTITLENHGQSASLNPDFRLYSFNNTQDCYEYLQFGSVESYNIAELQYPYRIIPESDEAGGLICVIIEGAGNYSYSVNGTVVQYETAANLKKKSRCSFYTDSEQIRLEMRSVEFKPQRSIVNPLPQDHCAIVSLTRKPCRGFYCMLTVNSTVFGTSNNIAVFSFSIVATSALILCGVFLFCFLVMQYKF